jgi:hypothetical protein
MTPIIVFSAIILAAIGWSTLTDSPSRQVKREDRRARRYYRRLARLRRRALWEIDLTIRFARLVKRLPHFLWWL